jgi:deoxycytidylate deaminase
MAMVCIHDLHVNAIMVPHRRIIAVYEAGASSQWHGVKAIVKVDGERWPIESTDSAQSIADRCAAAEAAVLEAQRRDGGAG